MKCYIISKKVSNVYYESSNGNDALFICEESSNSPIFAFTTKINANLAKNKLPKTKSNVELMGTNPENGNSIFKATTEAYDIDEKFSYIFYDGSKKFTNISGKNIPVNPTIYLPSVLIKSD